MANEQHPKSARLGTAISGCAAAPTRHSPLDTTCQDTANADSCHLSHDLVQSNGITAAANGTVANGSSSDRGALVGSLAIAAKQDFDVADASTASSKTSRSIYELHGNKQRVFILSTVSLAAMLVPLCDTVYLPALQTIQQELATTQELVAASVAVYMFAVGAAALVWGPASDRFGRRIVYFLSTAGFIATTLVCIFAPNIDVLVAFRALQGAAVTAYSVVATAVVADVYAPHERGQAHGISTVPVLIGPIVGPIVGGALSQAFSWRSTFILVGMFAALIIFPLLLMVPETQHYKKLHRLHKKDPMEAKSVHGAQAILDVKPAFKAPWFPLRILFQRKVALHAFVALLAFASMFCSLTELPMYLALPPYNLSPSMIGLCYIPSGIAGLCFGPLGGRLSDAVAVQNPGKPLMRVMYNCIIEAVLLPMSLLLFGWSVQYKLHLAVVLLGHFLVNAAVSAYLPSAFTFLTVAQQQNAGAAVAALHSMMFIMSGVLILVAAAATAAMGVGPFFSMLAGLVLLVVAAALVQIMLHHDEIVETGSSDNLPGVAARDASSQADGQDVEMGTSRVAL